MHNAEEWLARFERALRERDVEAAAGLFAQDGFWRDQVAFTWNLKTVEGREGVTDLLKGCLESTDPRGFRLTEPPADNDGVTEAWLEFETSAGSARGHLRLTDAGAWTLLTALHELKPGPAHDGDEPYVVVVGGGQCGIALGARLRRLGVPSLVLERHERAGDSWRKRYSSLALHTPFHHGHLPYKPFPDDWPLFSAKDQLADWLEAYTRELDVPYWTSAEVTAARYDGTKWTVDVDRAGERITLRPRHLVFATGMSGKPHVPAFPGQDVFAGVQHHSSQHPGAEAYPNVRAVVIGSNNSAHDIAQALQSNGADVTMVQRSPTHVVRSESLMELALGDLYSAEAVRAGVTTERADTILASLPYRVLPQLQIPIFAEIRERDADFYAALERAGFELDWGEDESGLIMKYLRRGSGYYIDVGACALVADGRIKLAHGQVSHLTRDEVVLEDGTALPADLVVYATGYESMNSWVAEVVSQEVADRVGRCWGHGSGTAKDPGPWEGEQRNMWKPTQQPGLWFQGGDLQQARYYSLLLALQLKARYDGLPTPVYGLQEVHHLS